MSATPPRRRRPGAGSPSSLPLVPILIGVIVLGFAIGAGLSWLTRGSHGGAVAVATASPLAMPLASASVRSLATPPVRVAQATPHPAHSHVPAAQTPATQTPATQTPATRTPATQAPVTEAPATPAPVTPLPATERPATARPAQHLPTRPPTPAPTRTPVPTPTPTAPPSLTPLAQNGPKISADSGFGGAAANFVRSYVDDLIAGNERAARAALGGSGSLDEKAYVDANTSIVSIDSQANGASAIVHVELATPKGHVFARYDVERNADGPYIRSHSITPP